MNNRLKGIAVIGTAGRFPGAKKCNSVLAEFVRRCGVHFILQ